MGNLIVKQDSGVTTISARASISASREMVWNVLKSPGDIERFHPLIKKSYMIDNQLAGTGSKRYCELRPIGVMMEKITEWKEGFSFTTEVFDGKMLPPFKFVRGTISPQNGSLEPTTVVFTFSYQLKFGWVGRLMNKLLILPQFKGAPPKYVEGLKRYVESS
ncbi:MAG: SRPBCC family protein [Bacteroidota bacterium]